jgi:hypothetical protein
MVFKHNTLDRIFGLDKLKAKQNNFGINKYEAQEHWSYLSQMK